MDEKDHPIFWDSLPEGGEDNPELQAMQSLIYEGKTPEELGEYWKAFGNEIVQNGEKTKYRDALIYYSKAIEMKSPNSKNNSIYYSNRAHVNLLLENFQKAFEDCMQSILHDERNVKAYYRGAKAALGRKKTQDAMKIAMKGLAIDSGNEPLKQLYSDAKEMEDKDRRRLEVSRMSSDMKDKEEQIVKRELKKRGITITDSLPYLALQMEQYKRASSISYYHDTDSLIFPLLLLYENVMQSDFIQRVQENSTIVDILEMVIPDVGGELASWNVDRMFRTSNVNVSLPENQKEINLNSTLREVLTNSTVFVFPILHVRVKN